MDCGTPELRQQCDARFETIEGRTCLKILDQTLIDRLIRYGLLTRTQYEAASTLQEEYVRAGRLSLRSVALGETRDPLSGRWIDDGQFRNAATQRAWKRLQRALTGLTPIEKRLTLYACCHSLLENDLARSIRSAEDAQQRDWTLLRRALLRVAVNLGQIPAPRNMRH